MRNVWENFVRKSDRVRARQLRLNDLKALEGELGVFLTAYRDSLFRRYRWRYRNFEPFFPLPKRLGVWFTLLGNGMLNVKLTQEDGPAGARRASYLGGFHLRQKVPAMEAVPELLRLIDRMEK